MDKKYLNDISPIIKDKPVWEAFIILIEYEQKKIIDKLNSEYIPAEALIRINAQFYILEKLKKIRDNANAVR